MEDCACVMRIPSNDVPACMVYKADDDVSVCVEGCARAALELKVNVAVCVESCACVALKHRDGVSACVVLKTDNHVSSCVEGCACAAH